MTSLPSTDPATTTHPSPRRAGYLHPGMLVPFILIVLCFAAWGVSANMTDPLVKVFGSVFSMSGLQSSLVQFAYYGAYFALAIPAAWLNSRLGYKGGVVIGLLLAAAGGSLFFPAAQAMTYAMFLIALFTLAAGLAILETSANPYVMAMGPPQNAARRLNFAQAFNPLGANIGVLLAALLILPHVNPATAAQRASLSAEELRSIQSGELQAVMGPYLGLAALYALIAIAIAIVKVPRTALHQEERATMPASVPGSRLGRLLRNRHYSFGVIAQFANVAAQTCVWTFILHYVTETLGVDGVEAGFWLQACLIVFLVFRFVMVGLMGRFDARVLMTVMCVVAVVLSVVAILSGSILGALALVAINACLSLLYPTIYATALQGLGPDTKFGAAGLVMGISGGAIMPLVQGWLIDVTSARTSFVVVTACFAVITLYGVYVLRAPRRVHAAPAVDAS